jgi:hypothetical protein
MPLALWWWSSCQSLLFLLSWEATHNNIILLAWPDHGYNPRSTAIEMSTLTITPADLIIISLEDNLFSPWYSWRNCWVGVKQQSLTHTLKNINCTQNISRSKVIYEEGLLYMDIIFLILFNTPHMIQFNNCGRITVVIPNAALLFTNNNIFYFH